MNKLEKIFVDSGTVWEDDAKECANITEELMIEFLQWKEEKLLMASFSDWTWFYNNGNIIANSTEELLEIFLKEKYGKKRKTKKSNNRNYERR